MSPEEIGEKPAEIKTEAKEKEPKISYHFFYSTHRTAEDFKKLEAAFKETDIYAPELLGWGMPDALIFQAISDGAIKPEDLKISPDSALFQIAKIIHNSKKPILLVDVPAKDIEYSKKKDQTELLNNQAKDLFGRGDFQGAMRKMNDYVIDIAALILEREQKIKENLKNKLKSLAEKSSELAKKELKVLISLGAFHTGIYQDLAQENLAVSREFSRSPFVYTALDEAIRRVLHNKEVEDELLAQGLIEGRVYRELRPLTKDSAKLLAIVRKITGQITLREIEQISKNFAQKLELDIDKELDKLGVYLPQSEEEIDEILRENLKIRGTW